MPRATVKAPFLEDSDNDSIATNSTAQSEQREVYNVERILAQRDDFYDSENDKTETRYLIKWEGYEIHRASWEPLENIYNDILIRQWDKRRLQERKGEKPKFNLAAFEHDQRARAEAKEDRQRRRVAKRKAKRRREGLSLSVSSSDAELRKRYEDRAETGRRQRRYELDSEDEELIRDTEPVRRKRVKSSPIKKKGLAQKVTGSSKLPIDSSSSSDEGGALFEGGTQKSEPDSLFDEGSQPIYADLTPLSTPAAKLSSPVKRKAVLVRPPTSAAKPTLPATSKPSTATSSVSRKSAPQAAASATKSVATGQAKRTNKDIFSSFSNTDKKRRERARVSDQTPKDSTDPKFRNLSTQNRFQKYSRNEKAPDINALTIVDPKTGRAEAPKPAPISTNLPARSRDTGEMHSAFGRDRSPARARRERSVTPPNAQPASAANTTWIAPPDWRRTRTCWHWMNQSCSYTAETCRFAHYPINSNDELPPFTPEQVQQLQQQPVPGQQPPPPPPPQRQASNGPGTWLPKNMTTCYYWQKHGACNRPDGTACPFAHYDTGHYSNRWRAEIENEEAAANVQPRTFVEATSAPVSATVGLPATRQQDQTCYFWKRGSCNKGARCAFAHQQMAWDAQPPASDTRSSTQRGGPVPAVVPPGAQLNTLPIFNRTPSADVRGGEMSPVAQTPVAAEAFVSVTSEIAMDQEVNGQQSNGDIHPERAVRFQIADEHIPKPPPVANLQKGSYQAVVQISTEGTQSKIYCDLQISGSQQFDALFYPVGRGIYFMPNTLVTADDLRVFLPGIVEQAASWPAGSIVPFPDSVGLADKLAECARLNAAGFVLVQDAFTLVIYPTRGSGADEWKFFDRIDAPAPANAPLRFRLLPPLEGYVRASSDIKMPADVDPEQRASTIVAESLLGLDADRLLAAREGEPRSKNVFIAWSADRDAELGVLVKYFQDLDCKVYHSGTPGAWSYFSSKYKAGPLVVHPDTRLWEIPGLYKILAEGAMRVFTIGLQPGSTDHLDDVPQFGCERLFAYGTCTFITDDVFIYHPERASEFIQQFVKEAPGKVPGSQKIFTRPGVKDWLRNLALERTNDRGRTDERYMQLYMNICELCPAEDEEPYDPPNPLPDSHLVSYPIEHMPSFVGSWERDEAKATDTMVDLFAAWSFQNAKKFRRFQVCYEPKQGGHLVVDAHGRSTYKTEVDPRGWGKRWQHVGVVRPHEILGKGKGKK